MLLLALLVACTSSEPAPAPIDTAPPSATTDPVDLSTWVAEAEGAWTGAADPTPVGPIPFALDFAWEDGDALSATASGYGMALTFRYHRDADGWHLTEEGSLPGGLTQGYTLEPAVVEEDRVEWIYADDPDYLRLVERRDTDALRLEAWVRGELHAAIDLTR